MEIASPLAIFRKFKPFATSGSVLSDKKSERTQTYEQKRAERAVVRLSWGNPKLTARKVRIEFIRGTNAEYHLRFSEIMKAE